MAADRVEALFFELFSGLPRQGPGTAASTRRALGLVPSVGPRTRVLDVGCGTGAQTLVLALSSPSHIVAVDNHPPFSPHPEPRGATPAWASRTGWKRAWRICADSTSRTTPST